jgi:hypothetical protein
MPAVAASACAALGSTGGLRGRGVVSASIARGSCQHVRHDSAMHRAQPLAQAGAPRGCGGQHGAAQAQRRGTHPRREDIGAEAQRSARDEEAKGGRAPARRGRAPLGRGGPRAGGLAGALLCCAAAAVESASAGGTAARAHAQQRGPTCVAR